MNLVPTLRVGTHAWTLRVESIRGLECDRFDEQPSRVRQQRCIEPFAANLVHWNKGSRSAHELLQHLGGAMLCHEAGATVRDAGRRRIDVVDGSARRQLFAAGTTALIDAMTPAVVA